MSVKLLNNWFLKKNWKSCFVPFPLQLSALLSQSPLPSPCTRVQTHTQQETEVFLLSLFSIVLLTSAACLFNFSAGVYSWSSFILLHILHSASHLNSQLHLSSLSWLPMNPDLFFSFCPNKNRDLSLWHFSMNLSSVVWAGQGSRQFLFSHPNPLFLTFFLNYYRRLQVRQQITFHIWIPIQAVLNVSLCCYSKILCFLPTRSLHVFNNEKPLYNERKIWAKSKQTSFFHIKVSWTLNYSHIVFWLSFFLSL